MTGRNYRHNMNNVTHITKKDDRHLAHNHHHRDAQRDFGNTGTFLYMAQPWKRKLTYNDNTWKPRLGKSIWTPNISIPIPFSPHYTTSCKTRKSNLTSSNMGATNSSHGESNRILSSASDSNTQGHTQLVLSPFATHYGFTVSMTKSSNENYLLMKILP